MVFSKEVASPDLVKVVAIKGAEPPRNAKELKSFLCTVQYNARFIESYAPQTDILRNWCFYVEKRAPGGIRFLKRGSGLKHGSGLIRPQCRALSTPGWVSSWNLGDIGPA